MGLMQSTEMKMYEHVLQALDSTVKSNQKAKFKLLDLIDNIFTVDIDYSSLYLTNFENYSVNFKNALQSPTDIYLYGLQIESGTSGKSLDQFTSRNAKRILITADIGDDKGKKITVPVGCFGAKFSMQSIFIRTGCNESPYSNNFYFEVSVKGKTCCGKASSNMTLHFKDPSSITFDKGFTQYQTTLADPIECLARECELESPVLSQMIVEQNTNQSVVLASHGVYSFHQKRQTFVPRRTEISIEPNTITIMLNELPFSVTQISYENGRLGVTVVRDGFSLRVDNAGPKNTFIITGKEVSFNACKALFNLPDIGVSLLEANFFGEFTVRGQLEDLFSLTMKYVNEIVIQTKDLLHSAFVYQELKVDWKKQDTLIPNLKFDRSDRFALKFDNLLFHFTKTEKISNYISNDSTIASLTTNPTRPSLELKEFLHMFQLRSQSLHLLHGHFYIHSLKSISLDIPSLSFAFMADLFSEADPKSEVRATAIFQIQLYPKSNKLEATVDICFKDNTHRKLCLSTDQTQEFLLLASIYSHYSDIEIHSTLVSTRTE